jgi:hypothetical protein
MYKILKNMLIVFAIAFVFMSTLIILMLPDIFEASRFWFLLSMPGASAWATLWIGLSMHDWGD